MRILYVGDIMGKPGRKVVASVLPKLKKDRKVDVVIAQAENVTHGKGMTAAHMKELQDVGIDVFSGGNHSPERESLAEKLNDPNEPVIRPANMDSDLPGQGSFVYKSQKGKVLVASILGKTFPKSFEDGHPLEAIDKILKENENVDARVINLHADFSSDKRIIGYYLDGRATLVVGDHWHVPTADAMILPKGTGHITDVGMCGTVHSSLGLEMDGAIERWKTDGKIQHNIVDEPPYQFNAVMVDSDTTGLAKNIESINMTLEEL